jgi:predicted nucleic acid-binding protein
VNPPTVLLERTFVAALVDPSDPKHEVAAHCYLRLIDDFTDNRRLLAVTSDTRREFHAAPVGLLAPVDTLHVAGQERHAAEQLEVDGTDDEARRDLALNLVLLRRRKIAAVATLDCRYEAFDVEVLPGFSSDAHR